MSTRGFIGFKKNNNNQRNDIYGMYNHYDSYYRELGIKVLELYKNTNKETFTKIFESITWINTNMDLNNLNAISLFKDECKNEEIYNAYTFLNDGLYCEYGYVYNLENDTLEIYRGFFPEPQSEDLRELGYVSYDNTVYHTHKVYTVTRDSDFDKIKEMFSTIQIHNANNTTNGKYLEEIIMEK